METMPSDGTPARCNRAPFKAWVFGVKGTEMKGFASN